MNTIDKINQLKKEIKRKQLLIVKYINNEISDREIEKALARIKTQ